MSTIPALTNSYDPSTLLKKAYQQAREEDQQLHEMFELLGWGLLPLELKYAIREDVKGVVDELKGRYASCDPFVEQRRKRVIYWVECYMDGVCSAETAVQALSY